MATVIVAGGSGVFGNHVLRVLNGAGHRALGLGRGPDNAIRADLLDRDGLLRAVEDQQADVIVHAATALKKMPMTHKGMYPTDDLRIAGTANLIEAAGVVGARRFVGENIVFGYGYQDFGDRVLDENDAFGGTDPDKAFNHHVEAMREKEDMPVAAGLDSISLRYGLFYGAGATETIVGMLRKHQVPSFDDHGRVLPWVNLADAATAVAAAIERGEPSQAYNIADESRIGFSGMVTATAEAFGMSKPMHVPTWVTAVAPIMHRIAKVNMRVSTDKARRDLGWVPAYPTVQDGLHELAEHASTPV